MFKRVWLGIVPLLMLSLVVGGLHVGSAQTDSPPDPRDLLTQAEQLANVATDISTSFNVNYTRTERVYMGEVFREDRVMQTEEGTANFVLGDEGKGIFDLSLQLSHERTNSTSTASVFATYEAEWEMRIINGIIYSRAAYLSGGGDFPSLERGWRILPQPQAYPLQSLALDVERLRREGRPNLGLSDLLAALDLATEVTFLPNETSDLIYLRITFTGAGAATVLENSLAQEEGNATSNPILMAIINDIRTNPDNSTIIIETLGFDAEGYLVERQSTFTVSVAALPLDALIPDTDPNTLLDFNQNMQRTQTLIYNSGLVAPEVPDLVVTPPPIEDTATE